MATSPHSNPEVAGSSLARSQCPYGSGFTPRLRLAGWRSARWDHLGGWEDRGISPPIRVLYAINRRIHVYTQNRDSKYLEISITHALYSYNTLVHFEYLKMD
ncbi:hypothetical protein Hanom_Chr04g00303311 [Helianthus anomalus]